MKLKTSLIAGAVAVFVVIPLHAKVPADEAKALGQSLTPTGAEKAGNADSTIPAYTGGLTKPPASFKSGTSIRPDPFADEKPLFSITAKDLAKYESKLSETAKELFKRHPNSFRMDVYKTHRTVAFPQFFLDNTLKNAVSAEAADGGLVLKNALGGVPFPIPKTGNEVMWNNALHYRGMGYDYRLDSFNVDSTGKLIFTSSTQSYTEIPAFDPKRTKPLEGDELYSKTRITYHGPARRVGEALMMHESVDTLANPRKAWVYLPGQRRVKLAPEIGYDTPNSGTAGMTTFDDNFLFNGGQDRFDFKLVGKREMYIPYNTYKLNYEASAEDYAKPNHIDPAVMRWELHRVWVVEATLKPGKRHIYAKRVFYVDEDSWMISASDQYDARGQLFRGGFSFQSPSYDIPSPMGNPFAMYDFVANSYTLPIVNIGKHWGFKHLTQYAPPNEWSPDALLGAGIR